MLFPALILSLLYLLLSAFFSSSETAKQQILDAILATEFSRFPVYRGMMDNIEGIIHTKDMIPYLVDNKEININELLRKPLFVPESASLEKVHRHHISSLRVILEEKEKEETDENRRDK